MSLEQIETGPRDGFVVNYLTVEEDPSQLVAAFAAAQSPIRRHVPLSDLIEAYTAAGYWYSIAKDQRRRSSNGEKPLSQFVEDYMESLVKSLDKSTMVAMHLGKQERYGA